MCPFDKWARLKNIPLFLQKNKTFEPELLEYFNTWHSMSTPHNYTKITHSNLHKPNRKLQMYTDEMSLNNNVGLHKYMHSTGTSHTNISLVNDRFQHPHHLTLVIHRVYLNEIAVEGILDDTVVE